MKHSHLRGLKLLFCATLALAIVLSLLPAQEAKALKQGQTCPDCGTGILIPISYNSEQHALSCSKAGCIHSTSAGYIWENHHGGNACTGRPICEGCGQEYGSVLGHDWQTEWTIDGDTHYYACSRCDAKKDEAAHTYNWTYVDDSTHKGTCACGAETTEVHYDRWADKCGRQPHCEKCDTDYGTPPEHEMIYEDRGESGHKPSCKHCDTYFFLEPHVGTSTCTETGTCSLCGGTIPALGHDWATTLTNGGDTHYYACSRCDARKDEAGHSYGEWVDNKDGTHTHTCACSASETKDHSYGNWVYGTSNHWRTCECGAMDIGAHHNDGMMNLGSDEHCYICNVCGIGPNGEILGYGFEPHTFGDWTDNGDGTHTGKCVCGAEKTVDHSGGTATCTAKAVCANCGQEYGESKGHDWATTLTNGGDTHYYACSRCDAKKDEAAHTYNWTYVDDSTCKGVCECSAETTQAHVWNGSHWCGYARKCKNCGEFYGEVLDHEYWYEYKTDEQHKINCYHCDTLFGREDHSGGKATCTEKAVCDKCGEEYGEALGHDWVVDTEKGDNGWELSSDRRSATAYLKCQRNGCGEAATVPAGDTPNLMYDYYVPDSGKAIYIYNVFAEKDGKRFYGSISAETDPTPVDCVYYVAGVYYLFEPQSVPESYDCHYQMDWWSGPEAFNQVVEIDGEYYLAANVDTLIYKPAFYVSKQTGTPATCTEPGEEDYWKCSICGRMYSDKDAQNEIKETVAIPALGHDWVLNTAQGDNGWAWAADGSSATAYLKCTRDNCGETATATDSAPQAGVKTYDANTGKVSCTYSAIATSGDKTWTGTSTKTVESDPIERRTDLWVVGDETYTTKPQSVPQSYDCHYQMDWWTGPTLTGDSGVYEENGEFYRDVTYTDTMVYKLAGYYIQKKNATPATCTEKGVAEHYQCWMCQRRYSEKTAENEVSLEDLQTDALGHDLKETKEVPATCTVPGTEAYWTCQRDKCGKMFSDVKGESEITEPAVIPALGHDLTQHDAQAPTCTAIGWDAYDTCSRCDYTTYEEKAALGHDLVNHDAQAPTCTEIGWDAYDTCSRCDYTTYKEIAVLGHDLIHHDAQAATCTEVGWDAYDTCSRCDYTTYAEKPALGHSEVTGTAIAPTCTDNGLTEGMYCFRCGQVLIAQEDIPALGHDFAVTHRTITRVYFQCSRCRDSYWIDNAKSRNLLSSLVWNDRDENVEYTAGVAKANGIKVLTITPDAEAVEDSAWVSLRLKPGDVEQWKREGIGTVAFQCGEVRMEISLSALTLDWFDLNETFDYYVFTLAPEEDGTLVTVETEIGTEKVAADEYDGITLVRGDTILEIVQNGIY